MVDNKSSFLKDILENAFDFLETAIEEFNTKPKYSIIHFSSSVELFLKARLVHEHWSLIVSDKPDKARFKNGDFKSITINESIEKIQHVLDEDIPERYQQSFKDIANHRNKVVHFFHSDLEKKNSHKTMLKIVREQFTGWHYLNSLLNKWQDIFSSYKNRIDEIHTRMKEHLNFLETVYEELKPEIIKEISSGFIFKTCPSCQSLSYKQYIITSNILLYKCKVCLFNENYISIPCSECNLPIELLEGEDNSGADYGECGHRLKSSFIREVLDTSPPVHYKDDPYPPINCSHCGTSDSIVFHNNYYICCNCRCYSMNISYCEWCNEGQLDGNFESSFHTGCGFCDGHSGHTSE